MSIKQEDEFGTFLSDIICQKPSSKKAWRDMIEDVQKQNPVVNEFEEDSAEMDNLYKLMGVYVEVTEKTRSAKLKYYRMQTVQRIQNKKAQLLDVNS